MVPMFWPIADSQAERNLLVCLGFSPGMYEPIYYNKIHIRKNMYWVISFLVSRYLPIYSNISRVSKYKRCRIHSAAPAASVSIRIDQMIKARGSQLNSKSLMVHNHHHPAVASTAAAEVAAAASLRFE